MTWGFKWMFFFLVGVGGSGGRPLTDLPWFEVKGASCEFCHMKHKKPKRKLYKDERRFMESLDEATALSVLLWSPACSKAFKQESEADLVIQKIIVPEEVDPLKGRFKRVD